MRRADPSACPRHRTARARTLVRRRHRRHAVRRCIVSRGGVNDGSGRRRERKHSYFDGRRRFYSLFAALRDSFVLCA